MRCHDAERQSVGRGRAGPKIRIRPQDRGARTRINARHHADQSIGHDDRGKRSHSGGGTGSQQDRVLVGTTPGVHDLGRDEAPLQPLPQSDQGAQSLVLGTKWRGGLRGEREAIHDVHQPAVITDGLTPTFRPRLCRHQRRRHTGPQRALHRAAHGRWQNERHD